MSDTETRTEHDSLGAIEVPAARLWGAQTERSRRNFPIGCETMPRPLIHALALVKQAAADVNAALGLLDPALADAIAAAAQEVIEGRHDGEFPLVVWQTGSGTQTNMNMNEVLANRASELLGGRRGAKAPVHPNDHVNLGQSSNDTFPTAIHVAAAQSVESVLLPGLYRLRGALESKARAFDAIVKIGRTHLQDAVPLMLGQEFSAYVAQLDHGLACIRDATPRLHALAQGGTAVGTGLNAHPEFGSRVAAWLAARTGLPFTSAPNKFAALAGHEALLEFSGILNTLSASLTKIANDIRLLASGPRAGLGEIRLPANEPGSSIMPGKVNPTQAEALAQVCAHVMGHHFAITLAAAGGQLELNTHKPLIAHSLLRAIALLGEAAQSFAERCIDGIEPEPERIAAHLERSLMLATALSPHIGYDAAARIVRAAFERGLTIRQAALESGLVSERQFDQWINPEAMTRPRG